MPPVFANNFYLQYSSCHLPTVVLLFSHHGCAGVILPDGIPGMVILEGRHEGGGPVCTLLFCIHQCFIVYGICEIYRWQAISTLGKSKEEGIFRIVVTSKYKLIG